MLFWQCGKDQPTDRPTDFSLAARLATVRFFRTLAVVAQHRKKQADQLKELSTFQRWCN